MITKIEAVENFRGTYYFISSRTKIEADGSKTFYPGMHVEWETTEHGEVVYDIEEAADKQVEMLVNQALLPFEEEVMENQKSRIIELFQKSIKRWKAFQEGQVREYVPWEEKKKKQAEKLLEQADPEILDIAMKMKGSQAHEKNLHPIV